MRTSPQKYLATNYDAYGRETRKGFTTDFPADLSNISFTDYGFLSEKGYATATETDPIKKVSLLKEIVSAPILNSEQGEIYPLTTEYYYDNYGRLSSTFNDYLVASGQKHQSIYTYDMRDNVLSVTNNQKVSYSGPNTFKHTWEYDTWGRMLNYYLNPTTSADHGQHIAHYDYDLRNRLTQRNLGKYSTTSNWLQSLDYTYNELDWLTAINSQGSTGLGNTQIMTEPLGIPVPGFPSDPSANPDDNDLFFLELKYQDPYTSLDVPAISRKSGDISQVWWRARGRNREGYGLSYDYLGRMTTAKHVRLDNNSNDNSSPGTRLINAYSEQLEYADQRGNIARILRYGMNYLGQNQVGSGVIDNLEFITDPGKNRILRINEQASDLALKFKGFRPKTEANGSTSTGGIDYTYDANGNLNSDPHKGISSIAYNYLNLPILITYADGRKITIAYDGMGNLLTRKTATTSSSFYYQFYVQGTEYRDSYIESVAHQEERLYNTNVGNNSAVWRYEYNISDHLGNTRLTFADKTPDGIIKIEDGEVLEEAHYYPFGLAMEGPWINDAAARDNRYKFNGIERVQDFGLNMDMAQYRSYDPAIGRWWQADPIAKAWENPYAGMYNNPMNWSDFLGADPDEAGPGNPGKRKKKEDNNLPEVVVSAKRIVNNAPVTNLEIHGNSVTYQRGNSWYMVTEAPLAEGGGRLYGYDDRAGWVRVSSSYQDYQSQLSAAITTGDGINTIVSTVVSLFMGVGAGATLPANASLRTLPIAGKYAAQAARAGKVTSVGENLALGLRNNLDKFSRATGAKNYQQFTSGGFKPNEIEAAIKNPNNKLHFNLTDFLKYRYRQFNPQASVSHGNITNWELHMIYKTPGALQRTTFYKFINGSYQTVPKPF